MGAISLKNVEKTYGRGPGANKVIHGVNAEITEGGATVCTNAKGVAERADIVDLSTQPHSHAADVPAAPVNNLDRAFAEPPVAEREMIVEYDHPDVGKVRLPGNPIKMSDSPTEVHRSPLLGEHTDEVLAELGYGKDQIAQLRADKVI